jgi:lysophospholipase L1-like esterase
MSAKNGSTRSLRLLGCLMVVALLGSALFASVASAKKPAPTPTAYVALGDSLSFGYKAATLKANKTANKAHCEAGETAAGKGETELAYTEKALCEPAASFEPGFVGYFGAKLAKTEKKANNALTTVNLGCPGETSDGLIGHLLGGMGAENNPCAYHNSLPEEGFPLKTEIGHTASQLEAAVSLITTKSAGNVTAVSLQIGSNDELHVVYKCSNPTYDGEHGFGSLKACIEHEAGPEGYAYEGGLFHHVLLNIGTTIGVLREVGYTGKVLVLGFYNPNATLLAGSNALQKILNENLEKLIAEGKYGPNVKLAQPFPLINPEAGAFVEGETEKEKVKKEKTEDAAICKYTEMCGGAKAPKAVGGDIHPTAKGYQAIGKLMVAAF